VTTARPPAGSAPATAGASNRMFARFDATNTGVFTLRDWGLFCAIAGVWGASFLFIDIGLDAFPPGFITFARVTLGAATLGLIPGSRMRLDPEDRVRMGVLAVLWVAVPFTLFPLAEQRINSAVTGLLNGGTPIFAAIVATVLVRQPPGRTQLGGIVVGFAGIVTISAPSIGEGTNEAAGVAMVVAATVCYGFALNIAAPLQQRYGPVPLMARMLAIASVLTAPYGLAELGDVDAQLGPAVAVAVLGVVGTGLAFAAMATLVGRVGSTRASFTTYLIPVVALGLGVVFRGDSVHPIALGGVVLVIAGAFLASRRA
jgi:drug/metabolite transporter (DMT)-like permease